MSREHIERLFQDHVVLMDHLRSERQVSFLNTIESALPKVLLLAAASDLEVRTTEAIVSYYDRQTRSSEYAIAFVENKALKRQFHSLFDWDKRNANQFFRLFGPAFLQKMRGALEADSELAGAVRDFCELGDLRNQMVHRGYVTFILEKTAVEVFQLYESALRFPESLVSFLQDQSTG